MRRHGPVSADRECSSGYLHPAQDDDEHPPHPDPGDGEPDDAPADGLPVPNRDMSFTILFEPHFSQRTSGFDPKTSFSKSTVQAWQ